MRNGILRPLTLAVVLALGFAAVWGVAGLYLFEIGFALASEDAGNWYLFYLADGTVLKVHGYGPLGGREYFDLDGNPVADPETERLQELHVTSILAELPVQGGAANWRDRLRLIADGRRPANFWYFVADGRPDGAGYFVGYDSQSRQCIGYLGTAGFRSSPLPAAEHIPFGGKASGHETCLLCTQPQYQAVDYPHHDVGGRAARGSVSTWDAYLLTPGGRIYHADLHARTIRVAVEDEQIRSAALVAGVPDRHHGTPWHLAVRTDDEVRVYEGERVRKRYPIPAPLRGKDFALAETNSGRALMTWGGPMDYALPTQDYRIFQVRTDGSWREERAQLPTSRFGPTATAVGALLPSPLGLGYVVAVAAPRDLLAYGLARTYGEALARSLGESAVVLGLVQALSVGLAWLCWRRLRRYGASRVECVAWPLFVLVGGVPAWMGWRFGRAWPVLEECPTCETNVPRDREACARCATEFPSPARKGTEVFA
jgi:hypothetical protein